MQHWKIAGLSLAIVKDGEVLTAEGFGLRNVEHNLPVTADTLFPIASCTKAFTATSVGLQVDAGKLEWDKPVRAFMPEFKLADTVATERITPRDLLCHRSGLPRHDLLWYASNFDRKEVLKRVRYVEPSRDFRTKFQYQNIMYMTAGYLAGHVDGVSWETFTKRALLDKLGMTSTNFSTKQTQATVDYATPYRRKEDEIQAIPFFENDGEKDSTGPAGNIVSTANDMTKWLLFNINGGKVNGEQIISEGNLKQIHAPHIPVDDAIFQKLLGLKLPSYGLGWFTGTFGGEVLIEHGGNIDGFSSLTSFLPERNIGVTVIVNQDHSFVPYIVSYMTYQLLMGITDQDWSAHYQSFYDEMQAAEKQGLAKSDADRKQGTQPSHPLEAYVGDYEHAGYGIISVRKDGDTLKVSLNNKWQVTVEHYHYDIFDLYYEPLDLHVKASFFTDLKGNIDQVTVQLEPNVADLHFKRLPPKADKALAEAAAGVYEWMETAITVQLRNESELVLLLSGQPERVLVPYQGTEFLLKDLSGFSIEFKREADGSVKEALLVQPGMAATLKKRGN
jgi:CubicO group peptidase (beta-lactamase class C family)